MDPSVINPRTKHEFRILVIYTILLGVAVTIASIFFYEAGYKSGVEYMRIVSRQEAIEISQQELVPTPTEIPPTAIPTIATATATLSPRLASPTAGLRR